MLDNIDQRGHVPHRILVVDDCADAANTLAMLLMREGYRVEVAFDGASALEVAVRQIPTVVLLDIGMPHRDGYQVIGELRKMPGMQSARVIAITGYGYPSDRARTTAAGFDLHLLKPIDFQQLLDFLRAGEDELVDGSNGAAWEWRGLAGDDGQRMRLERDGADRGAP